MTMMFVLIVSILLQVPGPLDTPEMGMPSMPTAMGNFAWWQYVVNAVLGVIGWLIMRYAALHFEKRQFAPHTAVSSEIREIRKLQKQGLITKEQAEARIEKLINVDLTPTNPNLPANA